MVGSLPLVVLVLGPLGWGSGTGCYEMFCVTCLGLPIWKYHAVHCLCLYLLDLIGEANPCIWVGFLEL